MLDWALHSVCRSPWSPCKPSCSGTSTVSRTREIIDPGVVCAALLVEEDVDQCGTIPGCDTTVLGEALTLLLCIGYLSLPCDRFNGTGRADM